MSTIPLSIATCRLLLLPWCVHPKGCDNVSYHRGHSNPWNGQTQITISGGHFLCEFPGSCSQLLPVGSYTRPAEEMWDYTPSFEDSERSFLKAIQDQAARNVRKCWGTTMEESGKGQNMDKIGEIEMMKRFHNVFRTKQNGNLINLIVE